MCESPHPPPPNPTGTSLSKTLERCGTAIEHPFKTTAWIFWCSSAQTMNVFTLFLKSLWGPFSFPLKGENKEYELGVNAFGDSMFFFHKYLNE